MTAGVAITTNGYRSRRAAVRALIDDGITSPRRIADRLGISLQAANSAYQAMCRRTSAVHIDIPDDLIASVVAMAKARDLTARQLVTKILVAVIEDDIVDAVLDEAADK